MAGLAGLFTRPAPAEGAELPPPGGLLHPSVRFERSDARFGPILAILVAAILLAFIINASLWRFFLHYRNSEAAIKKSNYPLAPTVVKPLPAPPRLEQVNRMASIEQGNVYLRQERKEGILDSYGAAGDGYIHIPIDRAMDYLAGKLPVRGSQPSAGQARRSNGLVDSGASNSGRMFRGSHD